MVQNGRQSFWYFTLARWACIPLNVFGCWVCYRWANELYGRNAGLLSAVLYSFCPNLLAWGASITPDAAAASLGVLAGYAFWHWLREPTWRRAALAGVALGAAELTKTTWLILFGLWPLVWLTCTVRGSKRSDRAPTSEQAPSAELARLASGVKKVASETANQLLGARAPFPQLLAILLLAVYFINLGYAFEGSFQLLGRYQFISRTLTGENRPPLGGNRFANSWLGFLPVPLPENYVRGIDVQKFEFEQGKWSYLRGEQKRGGWWYYYFYTLLVKTPVGTLVLFGVATAFAVARKGFSSGWRNELVLLAPAMAVILLVSSQTGFNRYLRYVLPAVPFLYIHVSRVALVFERRERWLSVIVGLCLLASVVESGSVFPHSMSFFNRLVGGPIDGPKHLLDANIDWGQDLLFLKKWYDAHPEARPFHVAYFGASNVDPKIAGIDWKPVPGWLPDNPNASASDSLGPQPGWFAVSVNYVYGYRHDDSDLPRYTYFQDLEPVGRAGYSIYIYHVTPEDVELLRKTRVAVYH